MAKVIEWRHGEALATLVKIDHFTGGFSPLYVVTVALSDGSTETMDVEVDWTGKQLDHYGREEADLTGIDRGFAGAAARFKLEWAMSEKNRNFVPRESFELPPDMIADIKAIGARQRKQLEEQGEQK